MVEGLPNFTADAFAGTGAAAPGAPADAEAGSSGTAPGGAAAAFLAALANLVGGDAEEMESTDGETEIAGESSAAPAPAAVQNSGAQAPADPRSAESSAAGRKLGAIVVAKPEAGTTKAENQAAKIPDVALGNTSANRVAREPMVTVAGPAAGNKEGTRQPERAPVAFAARLHGGEAAGSMRITAPAIVTATTKSESGIRTPAGQSPISSDARPLRSRISPEAEAAQQPLEAAKAAESGPSASPREADTHAGNGPATEAKTISAPQATVVKPSPTEAGSGEPAHKTGLTKQPQAPETHQSAQADEVRRGSGSATRIDLDLRSRASDSVNLQLVERGGKVHVAVRTPDPQLAGSLQDGLPRLVSRVEQRGFQAETWTPGEAASSSAASREVSTTESDSGRDPGGEKDSRDGHGGQQQQGRRRQDPPAWMEEFERNLSEDIQEDTQWTQLLRR
ncbi:MAG: hypothetical protein GY953_54165 [bacterium]|nr:hypothetical protein [bacterium]